MDKSFNDQELSDIMKEIEALEEEFSADMEHKVEATSVMEELATMDVAESIPVTNKTETVIPFEKKATPAPVHHTPAASSGSQTSMSFKVSGSMNLELQFDIGGKCVSLDVSETGLTIHMEGGVTFTVPVSDAHSVKKAV